MPRRTLARRNALLTLAHEPWTLFETDPNDQGGSGGGGGGPAVNEHGFPDNTPIAEMTAEHQAAYWKHQSRKHEQRATSAPDAAELQRLKDRDAALKKLEDDNLTETQRLQAERDAAAAEAATAKAERDAATRKALLLEIASDKGLTPAQASRLQGSTKEELEADADALKALFNAGSGQGGNSGGGAQRSGGNRGGDVGNGAKTVASGADLYKQRHAKD
jgi:hypothetical protein